MINAEEAAGEEDGRYISSAVRFSIRPKKKQLFNTSVFGRFDHNTLISRLLITSCLEVFDGSGESEIGCFPLSNSRFSNRRRGVSV